MKKLLVLLIGLVVVMGSAHAASSLLETNWVMSTPAQINLPLVLLITGPFLMLFILAMAKKQAVKN